MKRLLVCLLLVGVVGCGDGSSPTNDSQAKAEYLVADVSPLEKLGAEIQQNEQGEVVEVNLYGTKVTDAGLEHLKGLANLKTLFLADTQVTAAGLEHLKGLTKLRVLYLGDTQVTDAGLVHLKGLTKLEYLNLSRTQVTDAGLEHLKGLTSLESLGLFSNQITDAGLVHLKGLTKLKELDLYGTKVTDAGLVHLKGMQLMALKIPHDAKTDLGLKHYLAALETHTRISLENWRITNAGLEHLKGLTKLRVLYLSDTQITDAGVAELQKALPDCEISH
jgi:Leucine-rich repeat (LRR) protein